jgi:hypothetical protein
MITLKKERLFVGLVNGFVKMLNQLKILNCVAVVGSSLYINNAFHALLFIFNRVAVVGSATFINNAFYALLFIFNRVAVVGSATFINNAFYALLFIFNPPEAGCGFFPIHKQLGYL